MNRNLLRLAALVFALSPLGLATPRLATATTCGTGSIVANCSRTCCGENGSSTTFFAQGLGHSCALAQIACTGCLPACPAKTTLCDAASACEP
jgi:hypothetical protein